MIKLSKTIVLIALFLFFASCSKKFERVLVDAPPSASTEPSVEILPKVAADQVPFLPLQTRVGAVHTTTPLDIKIITSALKYPWSMAFLPDGRMLVTEKPGTIRIVTMGGAVGPVINGVPKVKYKGDSGLQDIVLDPDFASTRLVFWSFVEPVTATDFVTSIARAKLSTDETKFEEVTIIYRANPSYTDVLHPGSQLLFDKNGYLFACFGEHYDDAIREKNAGSWFGNRQNSTHQKRWYSCARRPLFNYGWCKTRSMELRAPRSSGAGF